jgi:mono/diheme cytochrome c family protein
MTVGCVVVVLLGLVFWFVQRGFSARDEPSLVESVLARRIRRLAIPRAARRLVNPMPESPEMLKTGMSHFADHCASCHGNDGSGATEMGRNLYPKAPDMRLDATQSLSDGELFSIIENGVRFTGMPAWSTGTPESAAATWHLVQFIRHLPALTPEELEEMKALNPKSPSELEEEREDRAFLTGSPNGERPAGQEGNGPSHQHH